MFDVNKAIYACDDVICRNIESFTTEQRGLLSQNILSQLRNFVEKKLRNECILLEMSAY